MSEQQKPSLGMITLKWGVIGGAAQALIAYLSLKLMTSMPSFLGFALMLAVFAGTIFMAHNEYKAKNGGMMGYGRGLGLGTLASLFSAVVVAILVVFLITSAVSAGMSEVNTDLGSGDTELDRKFAEGAKTVASGAANAVSGLAFVFTLFYYVFWGFITTLVVSAFTQKKGA